jgi:hypothetical protein
MTLLSTIRPNTFASLNDGTENKIITLFYRRHDDIKVLCRLKCMAPIALNTPQTFCFLADALMCLKLNALVIMNYKKKKKKKE